jgi:hypothetical protein
VFLANGRPPGGSHQPCPEERRSRFRRPGSASVGGSCTAWSVRSRSSEAELLRIDEEQDLGDDDRDEDDMLVVRLEEDVEVMPLAEEHVLPLDVV